MVEIKTYLYVLIKKRVLEVCLPYQQELEDRAIFVVEKMDQ